jgi:PAS domain S-box-containing protein
MVPSTSQSDPARAADEDALVFDTADPILASDAALRIVLWNRAAEALLGFTAGEVLGRPCHEILGCRSRAGKLPCRCGAADPVPGDPQLLPTFELEVRKKTGERVWLSVTTLAAGTRSGVSILVHLLRDLTRQKEIEALLRQVASSAARLSFDAGRRADPGEPASSSLVVTAREREVIRLLAQGASTDTIAAELSISRRTARNHIQNILGKLGVHSRLEAVAYASTRGLI